MGLVQSRSPDRPHPPGKLAEIEDDLRSFQGMLRDIHDPTTYGYRRPRLQSIFQDMADILSSKVHLGRDATSPELVAYLLGASIEEKAIVSRANTRACGKLAFEHGRFVISVQFAETRPKGWKGQRFTTAHECGHLLCYNLLSHTPRRIVPTWAGDKFRGQPSEEIVCDYFARALLLPSQQIGTLCSAHLEADEIVALSNRFDVQAKHVVERLMRDFHSLERSIVWIIDEDLSGGRHLSRAKVGSEARNWKRRPKTATIRKLIKSPRRNEEWLENLLSQPGFETATVANDGTAYVVSLASF